ncbi:endonuclease/exonuclease/phosphatase family protein [Gemmatimonas sp.]|uniref:endonuclease/exonuclease/phosphatase family protein n=1 Tax=Gemmatimonas sp. TaxID=1962908 RepID=UPI00286C298D|nr:endonuclease/exonuclease/phosphatase family protein [Gemmatimonas sp.]
MRSPLAIMLCTLAVLAACARAGTGVDADRRQARTDDLPPRIVIDGHFDDWRGVPVWAQFAMPAAPTTVTPRIARAVDDAHFWYLSIALRDTMSLHAMPGTMHLLIDADDSAVTGGSAYGMPGVDLAIDLSRLDKLGSRGHGAGVALRSVGDAGLGDFRSAYDLAEVHLPSWGADQFELRLARTGTPDGQFRFASRVKARLVFVGRDSATASTPTTRYTFTTAPARAPIPLARAIPVKAEGAIRVAHWNVSEGSFHQPDTHAKLLAAVAPDIIMLDEMHGDTDSTSLAAFFSLPELARLGTWRFVYGRSGGRQRGVVAVRGRAIRAAEGMAFMRYADGALDSLARTDSLIPMRAIETERAAQIASTGAWVDVNGIETLFVPLDVISGGYIGSPNDAFRLLQTRTIRRYILEAIGMPPQRAPVFIAGDFNAVASYASVDELQRSLDTDGSALTLNRALRLDGRTATTWRHDSVAQFPPGRLDLALFAGSHFEQTGGFVFATEDLADSLLASLSLTRDMSRRTSDHLIVVTDLRRRAR